MAVKKKEPPKAMTAVKADFVASLDNVVHQGIMLLTAVETALRHSSISKDLDGLLRDRTEAFRAALIEPSTVSDE